jgi:DNA-binding MarR family transcriptional regulator
MSETSSNMKSFFLNTQSRGLTMTVNTPKPNFVRPAPVSLSGQRLYLREDELDHGVARLFEVSSLLKNATLAARQRHALTWTCAHALVVLLRAPIGVAALALALDVTKQSAIKTAEELEGRGLLTRDNDARDARRRPLHLTNTGQDIARDIATAMRGLLANAYRQAGGEAVSGSDAVLAAISRAKLS